MLFILLPFPPNGFSTDKSNKVSIIIFDYLHKSIGIRKSEYFVVQQQIVQWIGNSKENRGMKLKEKLYNASATYVKSQFYTDESLYWIALLNLYFLFTVAFIVLQCAPFYWLFEDMSFCFNGN